MDDRERRRQETWDRRYEDSADKWTYHPWRQALKWFLGILVVVLLLSVIGNAFGILNIYWQAEKAKVTVRPRTLQKVFQPDNAIRQVAFFHDTCTKVHVAYATWQNNEQALETDQRIAATATNAGQQAQAQNNLTDDATNVTGALNVLQGYAQDYNSRSAQYTANPFKDHGLPYRINPPTGAALKRWTPPSCG